LKVGGEARGALNVGKNISLREVPRVPGVFENMEQKALGNVATESGLTPNGLKAAANKSGVKRVISAGKTGEAIKPTLIEDLKDYTNQIETPEGTIGQTWEQPESPKVISPDRLENTIPQTSGNPKYIMPSQVKNHLGKIIDEQSKQGMNAEQIQLSAKKAIDENGSKATNIVKQVESQENAPKIKMDGVFKDIDDEISALEKTGDTRDIVKLQRLQQDYKNRPNMSLSELHEFKKNLDTNFNKPIYDLDTTKKAVNGLYGKLNDIEKRYMNQYGNDFRAFEQYTDANNKVIENIALSKAMEDPAFQQAIENKSIVPSKINKAKLALSRMAQNPAMTGTASGLANLGLESGARSDIVNEETMAKDALSDPSAPPEVKRQAAQVLSRGGIRAFKSRLK